MKPQRIQLSRKRGFNLQRVSLKLNGLPAVNCARPSKWGNPFLVHEPTDNPQQDMMDAQHGICFSREAAVNRFRRHLRISVAPLTKKNIKAELRGKNLACWCPITDKDGARVPCHADVLLEIANR